METDKIIAGMNFLNINSAKVTEPLKSVAVGIEAKERLDGARFPLFKDDAPSVLMPEIPAVEPIMPTMPTVEEVAAPSVLMSEVPAVEPIMPTMPTVEEVAEPSVLMPEVPAVEPIMPTMPTVEEVAEPSVLMPEVPAVEPIMPTMPTVEEVAEPSVLMPEVPAVEPEIQAEYAEDDLEIIKEIKKEFDDIFFKLNELKEKTINTVTEIAVKNKSESEQLVQNLRKINTDFASALVDDSYLNTQSQSVVEASNAINNSEGLSL